MSGRVAGKRAVVTGAGSGIGRAVALRLAEEGAEVVVTSLHEDHVASACDEIEAATGRRPLGLSLDVARPDAVERVLGDVARRGPGLDVVVASAGIELVHEPSVEAIREEEWARVLEVNLTGAWRVVRAAWPALRPGAAIVTIGSANSVSPRPGAAAYAASKGGLLQLTRALALDGSTRGIRANCVCPGTIDTPLTDAFLAAAPDPDALRDAYAAEAPLGRLGTAREVAHAVLFLASDEASYITGAVLMVDGGMTV